MGLDHLPEAVQISPNWAYLLRAQVKKVQGQLLKLDEAQLREGKRKRCDAKKYIFDHGIKGVRRVMNKHHSSSMALSLACNRWTARAL